MSAPITVRAQVVGLGFDENGDERLTLRLDPESVQRLVEAGAFGRVVRVTFDPSDPSASDAAREESR